MFVAAKCTKTTQFGKKTAPFGKKNPHKTVKTAPNE